MSLEKVTVWGPFYLSPITATFASCQADSLGRLSFSNRQPWHPRPHALLLALPRPSLRPRSLRQAPFWPHFSTSSHYPARILPTPSALPPMTEEELSLPHPSRAQTSRPNQALGPGPASNPGALLSLCSCDRPVCLPLGRQCGGPDPSSPQLHAHSSNPFQATLRVVFDLYFLDSHFLLHSFRVASPEKALDYLAKPSGSLASQPLLIFLLSPRASHRRASGCRPHSHPQP